MADINALPSDLKAIWDGIEEGPMKDAWAELSQDGLVKILKGLLAKQPKRQAEATELKVLSQRFASMPSATSSGAGVSGELGTLLGVVGIGAGVGAAIVYHPDPHNYYCRADVIERALVALEDDDTRVARSFAGGAYTVQQLLGGRWVPVLEVSVTENRDGTTTVSVGNLKLEGAATAALDIAGTAASIARRFGGASNILSTLTDLMGSTASNLAQGIGSKFSVFTLKLQVWCALDKAAKPDEDAYWEKQGEEARQQRQAKLQEQIEEAKTRCPACGVQKAPNATTCTQCGIPF